MRKALALYQRILKSYPLGTQIVQTGALMATGDVLSQTTVERRPLRDIDLGRAARFGAIGTFVAGPALYTWYKIMDKYIRSPIAWKAALGKMSADQLLFAPSFIVVLVSTVSYSQGLATSEVKQKLQDTYLDILINNYKLWPMVQMFNFYLVPFEYRILVVQLVAIFWNTYLSWKVNKLSTEEIKLAN